MPVPDWNVLLEAHPDAALVVGDDGTILWINRAGRSLLGPIAAGDALDGVRPELSPAWLARQRETAARLGAARELLSLHGGRTWELRVVPFDEPASALLVVRDLTIDALVAAHGEEVDVSKMDAIGRLAGGVAHDFNNVLTVILGHAQLMLDDLEHGHPVAPRANAILNAAERAGEVTRALLAVSQVQVLERGPVDLAHLVQDVVDTMLDRLIHADVRIEVRSDPGLWPVLADPGQIRRVILNLAINAQEAMPDGGVLGLEIDNTFLDADAARYLTELEPGPYVVITVSDTGGGMDAATRQRIFEPFFSTKRQRGGHGLGLATVYGIVQQSAGAIRVTSSPGTGTMFRVYLPKLDQVPADDPITVTDPAGAITEGTETVLVVDDDTGIRDLLHQSLRARGYTVLLARDGLEALEVHARCEGAIAAMVTDVVMPRMGGPEAARLLQARDPELAVLFMSGYPETTGRALDDLPPGANLVFKPFTVTQLALCLRELLD